MLATFKSTLKQVFEVTASGIPHPYYSNSSGTPFDHMFARITSYPSLGFESVVPHDQKEKGVPFNVLIETESTAEDWEVQLWHSTVDDWHALPLERSRKHRAEICQTAASLRRLWFSGTLPIQRASIRPVGFTIRFRLSSESNWKWVQAQSGADDGKLLFQPPLSSIADKNDLSYYIDGLSSDLHIEKVLKPDTPQTSVWSVTANVAPARGESSGWSTHALGIPHDHVRWFSLVRLWSPWLAPRQGRSAPFADKDGVLYSFLRTDGLHVVILAISGIDDVLTTFLPSRDSLIINGRNDQEKESLARVVVAVGGSFTEANAAAMYYARGLVSRYMPLTAEEQTLTEQISQQNQQVIKQRDQSVGANWVEDWYDGFTYCTWNGLGQNLTEERISEALASLQKNGIRITNLIIDDNWQSLDNEGQGQMVRGWKEFEANPRGFPNGFKDAITKIRMKYPEIKHIGVWHAILGYWGGISPDGKIAKTYKTRTARKVTGVIGEAPPDFLVVDEADVMRMYNDFYSFLNSCGVDSVKTDAQFFLDLLDRAPARRDLVNTYLHAWTTAQLRHFAGRAISCMSQTPTILFRCQLPRYLPALPVRNSDDFFPDVRESHPWHVFCNAHNALMASTLNVLPDWDMFQTSHEWAGFHAAARCVSGGPVYITDEPGRHDIGLIEQMTARTIRDQTVVLRCGVVGRSTQAYIGFEEERLCLVGAYHGAQGTGAGVLGVFNCRGGDVTEVVQLKGFMGTEEGTGYIVRSHRTGQTSAVMKRGDADAVVALQIGGYGWDILTAFPVAEIAVPSWNGYPHSQHNGYANGHTPGHTNGDIEYQHNGVKHKTVQISNLGLIGKMTGCAAILSTEASLEHSGTRVKIDTRLKALGKLGIWSSILKGVCSRDEVKEKCMVLVEGKTVPWDCIDVGRRDDKNDGKGEEDEGGVLEVDVDRAWREMGLNSMWSNEVDVTVFLALQGSWCISV